MPKNEGRCDDESTSRSIDDHIDDFDKIQII